MAAAAPVIVDHETAIRWGAERGLPQHKLDLDAVNDRRRQLGMAPFAIKANGHAAEPEPRVAVGEIVSGTAKGKIERSLKGLAEALFDEIDALRDGTGSVERLRGVCQVAGRLNELIHTEIKIRKIAGTLEGDGARLKAITG